MMELSSYGLDVYTSEVDDHDVDFIVKDKRDRFCEIQVKSKTKKGYIFVQKNKFNLIDKNCELESMAKILDWSKKELENYKIMN